MATPLSPSKHSPSCTASPSPSIPTLSAAPSPPLPPFSPPSAGRLTLMHPSPEKSPAYSWTAPLSVSTLGRTLFMMLTRCSMKFLSEILCLNVLLNGYVETKLWIEGLSLFGSIASLMLHPDCLTISAVLKICAEVSVIGLGMQCHAYLIRRIDVVEKDAFLLSSLVEMYGKCGLVGKARLVFGMSEQGTVKEGRDVVLWTSMLNAYRLNGRFDDMISTFEEMLVEGTDPDEVVMLVVLSGCVHSGNEKKGLVYLESMMKKYGLAPRRKHYSCVIDMLSRAGELEKAWNFGNDIALEDDSQGRTMSAVTAWGAILTACRVSGNVKIGKLAFQRAIQLDPDNVGVYIELSNLYARVEMWDELAEVRKLMLMKGMKKDIGCSRLEVMN